jgi:hypothetical protein
MEIFPFFVGDVWILAGQSNMEGAGLLTGKAKPHPLVHSLSMRRVWRPATEPLHLLAESPDLCHTAAQCSVQAGEKLRKLATRGVGVGLYFAREMVTRSAGVPQGLICTAHGGTSMQQWSPDRKHLGGESLYASLLASVRATGQPVAGVLWYQGESDANPEDVASYTPRMKKLVQSVRRDLRQPRLPWFLVQIARHFRDPGSPSEWNDIQEQQRCLTQKIPLLETVSSIDLPLDDPIHIGAAGFPRLATRLASATDNLVYRNKRELPAPRLKSVRAAGVPPLFALEVLFEHVSDGLQASGEPSGFQLISPEGIPLDLIYKVELQGSKAKLHMDRPPPANATLSYGHGFAPHCNITDARGFSLPVFSRFSLGPNRQAFLPFIKKWNVTTVTPDLPGLGHVVLSQVKALPTIEKSYQAERLAHEGFINEHNDWIAKSGHAFFNAQLHLNEPMKLDVLMGYDGPFRLWIDEQPFFQNLNGTNPCFADESHKVANLKVGPHLVRVGMDVNGGQAWGFFLRFARKDLTRQQIESGEFVKPTYST